MTVEKVLEAHRAFRELLNLRLPYKKVRQLHRLALWLADEMDTYRTEERRAAEEWGAEIGTDGSLRFPDGAAQEGYLQRIREVRKTIVDGCPRAVLTGEDLEGQRLTLQGMLALEEMIEFGGDEIGSV